MPCLLCLLASALGVAANGKGPACCYVRDFPGARTRTVYRRGAGDSEVPGGYHDRGNDGEIDTHAAVPVARTPQGAGGLAHQLPVAVHKNPPALRLGGPSEDRMETVTPVEACARPRAHGTLSGQPLGHLPSQGRRLRLQSHLHSAMTL
jgi:hypothetical protein